MFIIQCKNYHYTELHYTTLNKDEICILVVVHILVEQVLTALQCKYYIKDTLH